MEALNARCEQAQGGRGQIVAAMAEAGVGKSRLFYEFKATVASRLDGARNVFGFARQGVVPICRLSICCMTTSKSRATTISARGARRSPAAWSRSTVALEDTLPYLFGLLGIVEGDDPLAQMDGQMKKRRTLEAIKRILLRESLNQPLIVIFEDLHWIDEADAGVSESARRLDRNREVLLLVNYRPEYSHRVGQQDLLYAVAARSAWARRCARRDAGGAARRRVRIRCRSSG